MQILRPLSALAAVVAAVVGLGCYQGSAVKAGQPAPAISATGSDGKTHTLASLTSKGPVFLYFIKEDCPINAQAMPYFKRLNAAYDGKATFMGVINADAKGHAAWAKRFNSKIPVLLDPGMKIIKAYGAERSPWVIEVSKDSRITKVWPGYSAKDLNQIGEAMAQAGGVKAVKLDVSGAPADTMYG